MQTPALHIQLHIQNTWHQIQVQQQAQLRWAVPGPVVNPIRYYQLVCCSTSSLPFFDAFASCCGPTWTTFIHKQILMKWKLFIRKFMFMFFLFSDFLQQAKKFSDRIPFSFFLFWFFGAALLVGASLATVNEPCSSNPISELQYVYLIYAIFYFI